MPTSLALSFQWHPFIRMNETWMSRVFVIRKARASVEKLRENSLTVKNYSLVLIANRAKIWAKLFPTFSLFLPFSFSDKVERLDRQHVYPGEWKTLHRRKKKVILLEFFVKILDRRDVKQFKSYHASRGGHWIRLSTIICSSEVCKRGKRLVNEKKNSSTRWKTRDWSWEWKKVQLKYLMCVRI